MEGGIGICGGGIIQALAPTSHLSLSKYLLTTHFSGHDYCHTAAAGTTFSRIRTTSTAIYFALDSPALHYFSFRTLYPQYGWAFGPLVHVLLHQPLV